MKKIVLDNTDSQLTIHNTPSGANFLVTSAGIEGLEWPEIRISSQNNPGQHGEFVSSNWYAGRIITIPIVVFGSTASAYNTNRKALIEALKFEADSDGQAVYKEIEFTDDDDEVYTTSYVTGTLRITRKYPKFCEGFITLRCPDPALLGADESSSVALSEGGGFDIDAAGGDEYWALSFDGVDDIVTIANDSALDVGAGLTLSAWIKPTDDGTRSVIVTNLKSNGLAGYMLAIESNDKLRFWIGTATGASVYSTSAITFGSWMHVLARYDGSAISIYVNGVLASAEQAVTGAIVTPDRTFVIGDWSSSAGAEYIGKIDQVRIWNKALSTAEIAQDYANTRVSDGLVGEWLLDDGADSTLTVINPNFNDGDADTPKTSSTWIDTIDEGWYLYRNATAVSAEFDTDVTFGGDRTLKLSTTDATGRCFVTIRTVNAAGYIATGLPVLPSHSYKLSVWVKTNNVAANSCYIQLADADAAGADGSNTVSTKRTGTNDWQLVTVTHTTASDAAYLGINLVLGVAGNVSDAWFARVTVDKLIASDTSGEGNDGTISGATWTQDLPAVMTQEYGFRIPSAGFDIDSQVGGSITVVNDGDMDAYPTITLRGPLTAPTISNATTGKSLQLSTISLSAGDSISIDMKNRTITYDNTNDYFQYKTSASDFWSLQPGSNVINFIDSAYDSRAQATIAHSDSYSGI